MTEPTRAFDKMKSYIDECTDYESAPYGHPREHRVCGTRDRFDDLMWSLNAEMFDLYESIAYWEHRSHAYKRACVRLRERLDDAMDLPRDANGESIHVGDVMVSARIGDIGRRVTASAILEDGFVEFDGDELFGPFRACEWVHLEGKTVEDVLEEYHRRRSNLEMAVGNAGTDDGTSEDLLAEMDVMNRHYSDMLQLREDSHGGD